MKILVATGSYPPEISGPATYSKLLADRLPQMGIAVDVLSFGRVRHMPSGIRHIAYALLLLWHARKADVIFAQDALSVGLPSMVSSFILGKRFLVRVPGDYAWEQSKHFGAADAMEDFQNKKYGGQIERLRKLQRFVVRNADDVIAPSRIFADVVRGWIEDKNKVHAIYNGVDLDLIERVASGAVVKSKTIISAGRLVYNKGFDMLIRAMTKLPGWSLEIAGDGPEEQKLKKLIGTEGLADRVYLVGPLGREELIKRIASSEIFALNTYYETFSFQIVEVLAIGTPVITTRTGALKEMITDGTNGILIEPNSELELLRAIEKVSSDPGFKAKLIEEGRKRSKDFSIGLTLEAVRKIITSLVQNHSTPAYKRRARISKIFRYLFSGVLAALTSIGTLYVFTDIVHFWYLISSVFSFLISFMVSFTMQKFFTFQDHDIEGVRRQAFVYLVVGAVNLLINTGLMYLFVEYAHMHYILAQIATGIIIAIESFIIYGMFIFNKKPAVVV